MPAELRAADIDGYLAGTWHVGPGSSLEFSVKHILVSRARAARSPTSARSSSPPRILRTRGLRPPSRRLRFTPNDVARDETAKGADWLVSPTPDRDISVHRPAAGLVGARPHYGELTLRGVAQAVEIDVEAGGFVVLESGRTIAGFTAHAEMTGCGSASAMGADGEWRPDGRREDLD